MTLLVRPEDRSDILEAAHWYEQRQQGLGVELVAATDEAIARIADGPFRYAPSYRHLRHALVRRFPYAVYFALEGEDVVIVAVLHQRRDRRGLDDRMGD